LPTRPSGSNSSSFEETFGNSLNVPFGSFIKCTFRASKCFTFIATIKCVFLVS
jgi:hypothetical protein